MWGVCEPVRPLRWNTDLVMARMMMYSEGEGDAFTFACSLSYLYVQSPPFFTFSLYVFLSPLGHRCSPLALEKIYMVAKQSALTVRTITQWHYVATAIAFLLCESDCLFHFSASHDCTSVFLIGSIFFVWNISFVLNQFNICTVVHHYEKPLSPCSGSV